MLIVLAKATTTEDREAPFNEFFVVVVKANLVVVVVVFSQKYQEFYISFNSC